MTPETGRHAIDKVCAAVCAAILGPPTGFLAVIAVQPSDERCYLPTHSRSSPLGRGTFRVSDHALSVPGESPGPGLHAGWRPARFARPRRQQPCITEMTLRSAALVRPPPLRTLGPAGTAGQLLGVSDVGVACVRWQRLREPARRALAPADMDLPHRRSFRSVPGLQVRTSVSSLGMRMKTGRMSAHCSGSAGCHRPPRRGHTGQTSGHRQVTRRGAPAIGKQRAGVLKHHDAVAEQAPALSGMRRHDVGRPAIRCVRGRTPRLMLAHDAPRSCGRR